MTHGCQFELHIKHTKNILIVLIVKKIKNNNNNNIKKMKNRCITF